MTNVIETCCIVLEKAEAAPPPCYIRATTNGVRDCGAAHQIEASKKMISAQISIRLSPYRLESPLPSGTSAAYAMK